MLGINGGEFLIILVVTALVVGPQRLPEYAEQLARLIKQGRELLSGARTRVESEFAEQGVGLDLADLDPRRYDPRRIVRDALMEPVDSGSHSGSGNAGGSSGSAKSSTPYAERLAPGQAAPFDVDAT